MGNLSVLHDVALFVEVACHGGFTLAGAKLGVPSATLSRRIVAMEKHSGIRLLNRTTRKVELSDAGRRYFESCASLVNEARFAQETLLETVNRPTGHVRVSMPVDVNLTHIGPLLPEFLRQFPGVTLDLDLLPRFSNLVSDPVDVAIRVGDVAGDSLVVRRLGSVALRLFAAPAYLALHGHPQSPVDLTAHRCIALGSAQKALAWRLERKGQEVVVQMMGKLGINNPGLIHQLTERGLGIAMLPQKLAREAVSSDRLVRVLRGVRAGWRVSSRILATARLRQAQSGRQLVVLQGMRTRRFNRRANAICLIAYGPRIRCLNGLFSHFLPDLNQAAWRNVRLMRRRPSKACAPSASGAMPW